MIEGFQIFDHPRISWCHQKATGLESVCKARSMHLEKLVRRSRCDAVTHSNRLVIADLLFNLLIPNRNIAAVTITAISGSETSPLFLDELRRKRHAFHAFSMCLLHQVAKREETFWRKNTKKNTTHRTGSRPHPRAGSAAQEPATIKGVTDLPKGSKKVKDVCITLEPAYRSTGRSVIPVCRPCSLLVRFLGPNLAINISCRSQYWW